MSGFRAFLARGNVLDLAVAVIIGAAFGAIVTSLADDLIMPAIGAAFGGLDFSSYFVRLGPVPDGYAGSLTDYAALKKAGDKELAPVSHGSIVGSVRHGVGHRGQADTHRGHAQRVAQRVAVHLERALDRRDLLRRARRRDEP